LALNSIVKKCNKFCEDFYLTPINSTMHLLARRIIMEVAKLDIIRLLLALVV